MGACLLFFLSLSIVAATPSTSLRQAAANTHVLIGAAVRPTLFSEPAYSETLAREFNMVEPEDSMKWQVIRREEGAFDFRDGDAVVQMA